MIRKCLLCWIAFCSPMFGSQPCQQTIQTNHLDIREGVVDADGAELFYRTAGKGEPLVILHGGIGLSQDYLLPYMLKLANSSFVILYDQRACGASTGEINLKTMTIETFVKDLDAIRKAFHCEKISILGHSWGGFVAMEYAIAHPDHVEKLILSNSMPVSSDDMGLFAQEFKRRMAPYQAEIDAIKGSKEFVMGDPDVVERYFKMMFRPCFFHPENVSRLNLRMTPIAAIHSVQVYECFQKTLLDKSFDLHPLLKKLQTPTLVIHGDSDQIPAITAESIHGSISHSKYVLLNHCGHFPYIEAPEEYFTLIETFLREPHPLTNGATVDLLNRQTSPQKKDGRIEYLSDKEREEAAWKIGGKIHFEERDGPDYLGLQSLNQKTRDVLKEIFHVDKDVCANNAKALLEKKPDNKFFIRHYEERGNPGVGEEMHATLLYTSKRVAMGHETLKDIYPYLREIDEGLPRDSKPTVQQIAQAYQKVIKPDWRFVISDVVVFKGPTGGGVISAQLLLNGKEGIVNQNGHPISGNFLHLTLASIDPSALSTNEDKTRIDQVVSILKETFRGKSVKIADKNGQADLEFGISGSTSKERIRP